MPEGLGWICGQPDGQGLLCNYPPHPPDLPHSWAAVQVREDAVLKVTTELEIGRGPQPPASGVQRPDFVMFGIPQRDGSVILFASTDFNEAELRSIVRGLKPVKVGGLTARIEDRSTTLRVDMGSFTMLRGETYIDALRTLMETWRPPEPGRLAIED